MIEKLLSSPALYRTLALFFAYPDEPLNPRLISRYTGTAMKSVLREIRKLEGMGIIRCRTAGQYKVYILDRSHPVHHGLRYKAPSCPDVEEIGGPPRKTWPGRPGNRSYVRNQVKLSVRKCSLTFGSQSVP